MSDSAPRYTLIVVADDDQRYDIDASIAAAGRALPDAVVGEVVPLDEHEVGAWLATHRGRRCRTTREVLLTPERFRPVVLDADLPPSAW